MDEEPIAGTLNFRSVAPYGARGGRVRPETLYRCGSFDDIGPPGIEHLRAIGVTTAFDLRSNQEKQRRPSPLLDLAGFRVVTQPHNIRHGDLHAVVRNPASSPDAAREAMKAIYRSILFEFEHVFRLLFRTAVDDGFPLAIHCTAGKDRTGIAVALILELLGVSRDDILEDYLKSRAARRKLLEKFLSRNQGVDFGDVRTDLILPVVDADPGYLGAMFATLDTEFGGIKGYSREILSLSDADIVCLTDRLTERG